MPVSRYAEAVDYLQRRLWHELPIAPVERAAGCAAEVHDFCRQ